MKASEYFAPSSLSDALGLLERCKDEAKLLAGGTDLVVQMKQHILEPAFLIDLKKIKDLKRIDYKAGQKLCLGALATAAEIHDSNEVKTHFPAISEAAGVIGSPQIRNRATIGGNICRAAPSADLPPILIALAASLKIVGSKGERSLLLQDFFAGPGKTYLNPDEILVKIEVAYPGGRWGAAYLRYSLRETLDLAMAGVAVFLAINPKTNLCENVKIALASVALTPMRAREAERLLLGQKLSEELIWKSASAASEEAKPISDVYGEAWYKKEIVEVLVRRAVTESMLRCK